MIRSQGWCATALAVLFAATSSADGPEVKTIGGRVERVLDASPPTPIVVDSQGMHSAVTVVDESAPLMGSVCGTCLDYCDFPRYYTRADFLLFQRDTDDEFLLSTFRSSPDAVPASFTTRDLDFDQQPGIRVTVGKSRNCVSAFEVTGMALEDYIATNTFVGNESFQIATGTGGFGFIGIDTQSVAYDSGIWGIETGYRLQSSFNPNISILVGARYIHLDETLRVFESGTALDPFEAAVPARGYRSTATTNDMFGIQIGSDMMIPLGRSFEIGGTGRAGIFINAANVDSSQSVSNSVVGAAARLTSDDNVEAAGVIEAGISATLRLRRNILIHGGYQLLWVKGAALASQQSAPFVLGIDPQAIDVDNSAFYFGPYLGLEIWWGSCR